MRDAEVEVCLQEDVLKAVTNIRHIPPHHPEATTASAAYRCVQPVMPGTVVQCLSLAETVVDFEASLTGRCECMAALECQASASRHATRQSQASGRRAGLVRPDQAAWYVLSRQPGVS